MSRTLRLRKCGEHDDCQIQSLDGGDWQHTPASRPLGDRLPKYVTEVEHRRLQRRLMNTEQALLQLSEDVARLSHDLEKERGERIEGHAKVQRQLGGVMAHA